MNKEKEDKEGNIRGAVYTLYMTLYDIWHIFHEYCLLCTCGPPELDFPGEAGLSFWSRAGGEIWRMTMKRMTCRAVWEWKERWDIRDGSQQRWAVLGASVMGQGDNHIILVPHVESIMGKWMYWRKMAGRNVLQVGVLVLIFVSSWTQHTIYTMERCSVNTTRNKRIWGLCLPLKWLVYPKEHGVVGI